MDTQLRIAGIIKESIVDGPGIRLVVFSQGCRHNCPGCHNPETHDFNGGTLISIASIMEQIKKNPLLDGVTFSGGEPFEQAAAFTELAGLIKGMGLNIMTYTGYTYEQLTGSGDKHLERVHLLNHIDILVDGRFELDKRNSLLRFRGSENQRIIDVKRSRLHGRVELMEL